jgi:hypothetical protein
MKTRLLVVLAFVAAFFIAVAPLSRSLAQNMQLTDPVADEIARLEAAAANIPGDYVNPSDAKETFSHLPVPPEDIWQSLTINGAGQNIINQGPGFHNSSAQIVHGNRTGLQLSQVFDVDFATEQPDQHYNNVYLVGFAGYVPTADKVVIKFKMRVEPDFYGTTGVFLEPQGTFGSDGNFQIPADWFGVSYAGTENYNAGLMCNYIIAWTPQSMQPISADPFEWNDYKIILTKIDQTHMQAVLEANGQTVCSQVMPRFPIELQVWSDNYKVTVDENGMDIGFNNPTTPQAAYFDAISVKTK